MKKICLIAFTVLAVSQAFAQRPADLIASKIDRLSRALAQGRIDRMSRIEKDELNGLLDRALEVVRDDGRDGLPDDPRFPRPDVRPFPGPGPGPVPGPVEPRYGRHGRREGMMVVALLENNLLVVRGRNMGDLLAQCTAEVSSGRYGSVDDIIFTMNGGPYRKMYNSASYWRGSEICNTILVNADFDYMRAPYITVGGNIENRPFSAEGSRGEILETCFEQIGTQAVDDIMLSVNNGRFITARNSTSYWRTKAEVCGQIATMIDSEIR